MVRELAVAPPYSLHATCAPVDWARGRWADQDWIAGELVWVGWETGRIVHRRVRQPDASPILTIEGDADPDLDRDWVMRVLGTERFMPEIHDPVVLDVAMRNPGMRPHASGTLFSGLVDAVVGQSITVKAAAVVSARLASHFHPGIEIEGRIFWPSPRPVDLANADAARLRVTGLTWKRAEALVAAGQAVLDGRFSEPIDEPLDSTRAMLRRLPLVGPWTAESALLWGIAEDDAFPMGDVALLRAARNAYGLPEMTMKEMEMRAPDWAGHRAWASRLLWLELFGAARPGPGATTD
ncbi:MAG: hypothetical protein M9947_02215 [Thermomicrobiales bacterium]|nr:hypothetical protein [Thermomicrobiales bacterium]